MQVTHTPPVPAPLDPQVQQAKLRLGIVGNAPALIAAVERALRVAPIDLSVLVTGESGSGKEFFPKIIHQYSARRHAKYIAVNCGAIPEGTIDSELFGHEKGAFTGAVASRKGYFEEAHGGTIFLDEVAELPMTTQARLLRVLETGEFIKVGSSQVQKTDIRVVAATNVDMARAVAEGRFREDLYYRLSTVQIAVPPLRDRGSDINLLARKFAADFAEHYRVPPVEFTTEAREVLLHYSWPGNVRQLKNIVEQVALFDAGTTVSADTLRHYLPAEATFYTPAVAPAGGSAHSYEREREMLFNMIFSLRRELDDMRAELESAREDNRKGSQKFHMSLHDGADTDIIADMPTNLVPLSHYSDNTGAERQRKTLEDTERETIRQSLERNGGRRNATARELKISERTLYRKIKEYGLE